MALGGRLIRALLAVFGLVVIGGVIFLGVWDIEPPTRTVEKVIPNERLLPL